MPFSPGPARDCDRFRLGGHGSSPDADYYDEVHTYAAIGDNLMGRTMVVIGEDSAPRAAG